MLWDQNDRNESIDLTKSQKRDLFALQNYGAFRTMNTNTYRYYWDNQEVKLCIEVERLNKSDVM